MSADGKSAIVDAVDGEQLEHMAKPDKNALLRIREYAGTIMTDWQLATALTHLADMVVDDRSQLPQREELRAFYLRSRDILLVGLPADLQGRIEKEQKVERRDNLESLTRLQDSHDLKVHMQNASPAPSQDGQGEGQ